MIDKSDEIIITFYFVSGQSMDVTYSKTNRDELVKVLQKCWSTANNAGENFGINFSLVTHYIVKKA